MRRIVILGFNSMILKATKTLLQKAKRLEFRGHFLPLLPVHTSCNDHIKHHNMVSQLEKTQTNSIYLAPLTQKCITDYMKRYRGTITERKCL